MCERLVLSSQIKFAHPIGGNGEIRGSGDPSRDEGMANGEAADLFKRASAASTAVMPHPVPTRPPPSPDPGTSSFRRMGRRRTSS